MTATVPALLAWLHPNGAPRRPPDRPHCSGCGQMLRTADGRDHTCPPRRRPRPLVETLNRFPGAHVQEWDDVPDRCPLDGGPWRRVDDGVACCTCRGHLVVAARLRQLLNWSWRRVEVTR